MSGSLPGSVQPITTTTTTKGPLTTWPTRPTTSYPNWPPPVPTHSTRPPNSIYTTTSRPQIDNTITGDRTCGIKNGNPVIIMVKNIDIIFVNNNCFRTKPKLLVDTMPNRMNGLLSQFFSMVDGNFVVDLWSTIYIFWPQLIVSLSEKLFFLFLHDEFFRRFFSLSSLLVWHHGMLLD